MLRRAGGKDVDGVGGRSTGVEFCLEFFSNLLVKGRHVEPAFRQGIGKHHAGTAGMGHDGEILSLDGWEGEDTAYRGEFLTRETPHDAGFTEQGFHGGVAARDGTGVRRCRTASAFRTAGLDGGNAASLADE